MQSFFPDPMSPNQNVRNFPDVIDLPCGELDPLPVEYGIFFALPIPASIFHGAGTGHYAVFSKCSMNPSGSADPK